MGILYYINYHTKYKTKSMQRKGNSPSPESNCPTYLMYIKNLILTRNRARVISDAHSRQWLKNDAKKKKKSNFQ